MLALDLGNIPDAFTSRCGRELGGPPSRGAYVAAAVRFGRSLFVQGDTRGVQQVRDGGCTADLPIVMLGDNLYETRPGFEFSPSTPAAPLLMSTLRGGFEFGPAVLRTNVKGGGGVVWGGRKIPVAVGSLGAAFGRSKHALYVELEMAQAWVRAYEPREVFRHDSNGAPAVVSRSVVHRMLKPSFFALRAGLVFRRPP